MKELLNEIDNLQKQIHQKRPLDEHSNRSLKEYYKIGLTYSSNSIEGNTLTESETKVVIEDGLTVAGKPLKYHLEAVGHAKAFDEMINISQNKIITVDNILFLHFLFYNSIDSKNAGKYRKSKVFISGSKYSLTAPEKIEKEMEQFIQNINEYRQTLHPVVASAKLHKEFVFIHPFVDGNGRVARLLMNLYLLQENYNIAIISPIQRVEYIQSLEDARKDDLEFIKLIAQSVKQTQKDYLRLLNV